MSKVVREPLPGGVVPDPIELFKSTLEELLDDVVPYLLAGVGQMVIVVPLVFVLIFFLYFVMFGTMFGGIFVGIAAAAVTGEVLGDDAAGLVFMLTYLGTWAVMLAAMVFVAVFIGAVLAPTQASLVRRVAEHQRGGRKLDFTACFSDAFLDLPSVVGVTLLVGTLFAVGMLLCYLPGLVAIVLLGFASSLVVLHRMGPVHAARTSVAHVMANPGFHGMFGLLYFATSMLAAYIPIIGTMFLMALHVRAARTLFGDGEEAVVVI
ncbi:MAG: hypothetical protein H6736_04205 [Alphaproteobacteria bacterium]|nr:hypothetical protein [Alphaproteobacteria bacterium]MCB9690997.1 hypothetical protein [Alphaproteobacteria bacterium]